MLLKLRLLMIFCVCSLDFLEIVTYADSSCAGNTTDFALWTTVEVGVGIIAACCATLRPLLHVILVKTGHRPSSYKESSRDPNTGRTGRYAGRNKAYPCGDTDNISMDELRPDLVSHM